MTNLQFKASDIHYTKEELADLTGININTLQNYFRKKPATRSDYLTNNDTKQRNYKLSYLRQILPPEIADQVVANNLLQISKDKQENQTRWVDMDFKVQVQAKNEVIDTLKSQNSYLEKTIETKNDEIKEKNQQIKDLNSILQQAQILHWEEKKEVQRLQTENNNLLEEKKKRKWWQFWK